MKKRKTKRKDIIKAPEAMPEAAYNVSPDDVEIGDDLTSLDVKNKKKVDYKEDH